MDESTEGPKGPKPFRFKGTPAAKSRHHFALAAILVGAGFLFLFEKSPGSQNAYRKFEEFDKRHGNTFEDEMTKEQFGRYGFHQLYTRDGGAAKAKKKFDETHEDDPIFV